MSNRPLILVSNDDSISSKGIHILVKYLSDYGDVYVVAPQTAQSGKSSAITVEVPLIVTEIKDFEYATKAYMVNGTPTDCTKLALDKLLPRRPDYVVSGINHGANTGISALYSGTMGVAFEGALNKIPSVAFSYISHNVDADLSECENVVRSVMDKVVKEGMPEGICYNVNIPAKCKVKGVKTVSGALGVWTHEFVECENPRGQKIYWLTGSYENFEPENKNTDLYVNAEGYASLVPCCPEQTATPLIADLKNTFDVDF